MNQSPPVRKRLAESRIGVLLAACLSLLWLVSMAVVDGHASSFYPVSWVLAGVVVLAVCAQLLGYKVVSLSWTGWFGLLVGGYFAVRCAHSPSLVDSWFESGLIFGAFVFYMAGLYAGQTRGFALILWTLALAVILNVAALWLMGTTDASVHLFGRPEYTLAGLNTRNVTLFVYKNFAGLMLALCGGMMIWLVIWCRIKGLRAVLLALCGVAGVVASFFCGTRVMLLEIPLLCAIGSFLWIFLTLYKGKSLNALQLMLGSGLLLLLAIFVVDCFLGQSMLEMAFGVDSHRRFMIWGEAWRIVGDAPPCGFGASSAQWLMAPLHDEWALPNYVHNDYLQAWVDYGIVGLALMFLLLVALIVQGVRAMASDYVSDECKVKAAMALLGLGGIAAAAVTDFVWHNFAIVTFAAFCCGILATPFRHAPLRLFDSRNWAPGSKPQVPPLRAQTGVGKVVLLMGALGLCLMLVQLGLNLRHGWNAQWQYDKMVKQNATVDQRRAFLVQTATHYPDSRMADEYALMGGGNMYWPAYEQMLKVVLEHNPLQIFTAAMLADVLGRQQKFHEAERVFRRYYPGDGPDNKLLNTWAAHYATHLFAYGQQLMSDNKREPALSMLMHADRITKAGSRPATFPGALYRPGAQCWVNGGTIHRRKFIENCRTDIVVLQSVGVQPDHSWKAPLEPGGKPALYSRYMHEDN
ncbi:MAG: O-antigen ligase family protein [Akkermansia sp.]|nr:O-antigen ligase family protein [Akkermansia sp.]